MLARAGFHALSRSEPWRRRALTLALGTLLAAVAFAVVALPADAATTAAATAKPCPNFRVLHHDRIGDAVFPAGRYTITLEDERLTCKSGGELFARFLEDFDGNLPGRWRVVPQAIGKSSFRRGTLPGFSVELIRRGGKKHSHNPDLGKLCPDTFTVNSNTVIRPLRFTKGRFLIYLPPRSGITCNRAAVLFTRFLGAGGTLPRPWRVTRQTATFYKPSHPARSAFRIAPLAGAGRR